jgi:hypothetical protein
LQLGEHFLTGYAELFRERGYAGLACHVTPLLQGSGGIPHGPLDGGRTHCWRFIECP